VSHPIISDRQFLTKVFIAGDKHPSWGFVFSMLYRKTIFMRKGFIFLALLIACLSIIYFSRDQKPREGEPMVFPVGGKRSNIGSFWDDERDGGKRRHRGIDIFAKKGTAVVAIEDGVITSRGNTKLGGKVLWLRPSGAWWRAYYAHLDEQLVNEGDFVRKGQVIGTVGNTGNARTTPAHLHFGIYTLTGALDPLPYVKVAPKILASKLP
jgi:murein DD-endopeptidase MepM/ murein hydrolase activator NlpD